MSERMLLRTMGHLCLLLYKQLTYLNTFLSTLLFPVLPYFRSFSFYPFFNLFPCVLLLFSLTNSQGLFYGRLGVDLRYRRR